MKTVIPSRCMHPGNIGHALDKHSAAESIAFHHWVCAWYGCHGNAAALPCCRPARRLVCLAPHLYTPPCLSARDVCLSVCLPATRLASPFSMPLSVCAQSLMCSSQTLLQRLASAYFNSLSMCECVRACEIVYREAGSRNYN